MAYSTDGVEVVGLLPNTVEDADVSRPGLPLTVEEAVEAAVARYADEEDGDARVLKAAIYLLKRLRANVPYKSASVLRFSHGESTLGDRIAELQGELADIAGTGGFEFVDIDRGTECTDDEFSA